MGEGKLAALVQQSLNAATGATPKARAININRRDRRPQRGSRNVGSPHGGPSRLSPVGSYRSARNCAWSKVPSVGCLLPINLASPAARPRVGAFADAKLAVNLAAERLRAARSAPNNNPASRISACASGRQFLWTLRPRSHRARDGAIFRSPHHAR
jgi:hypothetical protein